MKHAPPDTAHSEAARVARTLLHALDADLGGAAASDGADATHLPEVPGVRLHSRVGFGGMGSVFRGKLETTGEEVAVKILHPGLTADPAMTARFAQEAATLRRLRHPHVLRVLEAGTLPDGRAWLVTAWAEGGDLRARLRQGRPAPAEALRWFREACLGVAAAHGVGILHRDLKPANLLLDAHGRVLVADFGLAKLLGEESHALRLSLTLSTDVFGTPYYVAPEARLSAALADERADLFSLGVLLHEMLTGRVPIGHYKPASHCTAVPAAVDAVIARCLQEDPAARPTSVPALLALLDAALAPRRASAKFLAPAAAGLLAAIALYEHTAKNRPPPLIAATPAEAAPHRPWQNSLAMRFVPVPGARVLISVWETRRSDFAAWAATWPAPESPRPWQHAGFAITPEHPVNAVSAGEADAFCRWLTQRERDLGLIGANAYYRLPTDDEWLAARGTTTEPWQGNFAGQEAVGPFRPPALASLPHRDAWPQTAPVGSFPANEHGLHDMAGNVAEWCRRDSTAAELHLRGGSWNDGDPAAAEPTHHRVVPAFQTLPAAGFRTVLDPGSG